MASTRLLAYNDFLKQELPEGATVTIPESQFDVNHNKFQAHLEIL
jgi:hypothetical protein